MSRRQPDRTSDPGGEKRILLIIRATAKWVAGGPPMPRTRNPNPNPKRVLAGKLNRAKRLGLTPAGREKLRRLALEHRPWRFSTGPRTPEGKAKVAANGRKSQRGPR